MKGKTWGLLAGLLAVLLLLGGCVPTDIPSPANTGKRAKPAVQAAQPTDGYPITVGGTAIQPPVAVETLEASGWRVAAPEADRLAPGETSQPLAVTRGDAGWTGRLYNPGKEPRPWRECPLVSVWADRDVEADGGVTIGSLRKDVSHVYGDADEGSAKDDVQYMIYGTGLYYGLEFGIDAATQKVAAIASFCIPLGETEERP